MTRTITSIRGRRSITWLAAALLGLTTWTSAPAQPTVASPETATVALADDQPLFKLYGQTVTAGEWEHIIRFSPPEPFTFYSRGVLDLDLIPRQVLVEGMEEYAYLAALGRQAREYAFELSDSAGAQLENELLNVASQVWMEENGIVDVGEIEPEAIEKYYEENKEQFLRHEQLTFRHIFLSTYEPYSVQEGDSLESIAQKVAGDAALADQILSNETKRPRIEAREQEQGEVRPLTSGETVMVPMGAEKVEEVARKARQIHERLKAGEEFVALQTEFLEGEGTPPLMNIRPEADSKPILPEIREAFLALENNQFSEPIRTKHGYQILYRISYQPKAYTPLDDLRPRLRSLLQNQRRQEVFEGIMEQLWKAEDSVEIDQAVLSNVFDPAMEMEVIMQIGDVKYIGSQFVRDFGAQVGEESTLEERRAALVGLPMVQRHLVNRDIDRQKIREKPTYKQRAGMITDRYYATYYMNELLREMVTEPAEEEVAALYEERKEQLRKTPAAEVWQISAKVDADPDAPNFDERVSAASEDLANKLAGVTSVEQFMEAARKFSEDDRARAGGAVGMIGPAYLRGLGQRLIELSEENSMAGPFTQPDGSVYYFWVGKKQEEITPTLDMMRERLVMELRSQKRSTAAQELRRESLEKAGFEVLLPEA